MRVSVESVFQVGKAVACRTIDRRHGKLINACSAKSELSRPSIAPNTATRRTVKMLTNEMCADWRMHGMQVDGIGTGHFKTELNNALVENSQLRGWRERCAPPGRWGDAVGPIGAATFPASCASTFVNGHIFHVAGNSTSVL
jgi:gluconate 5-dehydrogenase